MTTIITGRDSRNREHTGAFVAVTMRTRRTVYVRLIDHNRGPIVKLTPAEFAALGPIEVGYKGLHIGDTVNVTWTDGTGASVTGTGTVESVLLEPDTHRVHLMVHEKHRELSAPMPLCRPDRLAVEPAA